MVKSTIVVGSLVHRENLENWKHKAWEFQVSLYRYAREQTGLRYSIMAIQNLSAGDAIALATLIIGIPSILASIIGVIIGYRGLDQFKSFETILPLHHAPSRELASKHQDEVKKFGGWRGELLIRNRSWSI